MERKVVCELRDPEIQWCYNCIWWLNEPHIKDGTHMRKTGSCVGVIVNFSGDMVLQCRKCNFLNNETNKQEVIIIH